MGADSTRSPALTALTTCRPTDSRATPTAAYKTIKAVEKSLNGSNSKVVVCIQTDGHENASHELALRDPIIVSILIASWFMLPRVLI
jgi:hypothetical protein